jgi:hypothetical protein
VTEGYHKLNAGEWQVNDDTRQKLSAMDAWLRAK